MRSTVLLGIVITMFAAPLLVTSDAWAHVTVEVLCPATAKLGATVTTTVKLTNGKPVSVTLTRGARLLHLGDLNIIGPTAFSISSVFAPGQSKTFNIPLTIPTGTGGGW